LSPGNVPRNAAIGRPRRIVRHAPPKRRRRKPMSWKARGLLAGCAAVVILLAWAALARGFAPTANTSLTRFDAIIVLGTPADSDGNPRPEQLARVTEAVNEYKRGVAPRLILTGGAAHNQFVEARVMARTAEAQGIPEPAILIEPEARDTIQNACYSERIMKAHGWRSAEIVASAIHLPRAGLIFNSLPLQWSAHAAPPLSPGTAAYQTTQSAVEVLKTARYLIWARWVDRCEP
jgi:uncharacterized SAM-binding protein YcdF (DUF218 family)